MLVSVSGLIRTVWAIAVATYKEWFAYRTHSLVSAFTGPAQFLIMVSIWRAVYTNTGAVGGLSLDEMIAYYSVSTLISYLTMDSADWNLQMLIRTGKYTMFALRPLHHRLFAFSQKAGHRTLGVLFEFLPVYLIFTFAFRFTLRPAHWACFLASVALAWLMVFYINYSLGLAGFWLVNTGGLRSVVHLLTSVCSGALFPLLLLPPGLQRLIFFLPFQFTSYVPCMIYAGRYSLGAFSMGMEAALALQAAYVLGFWGLSEVLYRAGMKRYTAVGA